MRYKLEDWIEEYKSEDGTHYWIPSYKISRIKELEEQLEKAKEVIGFYANKENYDCVLIDAENINCWYVGDLDREDFEVSDPIAPRTMRVGGKRARNYLKKIEGKEG